MKKRETHSDQASIDQSGSAGGGLQTGSYSPIAIARRAVSSLDFSVVGSVLAVKALLLVFGVLSWQILENKPSIGWLNVWNRWDAANYQKLAVDGYQATGDDRFLVVFLPLYPWLIRAFSLVVRNPLVAAFIISGIASVAAAILLQRLVSLDESPSRARSAVLFLLIFPTAYFLHIGHTESLFLALVLGCFIAARRGKWIWAAVIGCFAVLTRINGLVLLPALAFEAWDQYRQERQWNWQWVWIPLVCVGFVAYLFLNYHVTGNAWTFMTYQREHWFRSFDWPWVGIRDSILTFRGRTPEDAQIIGGQELLFMLIGLVGTAWSWVNLRKSYSVWMTGNWLMVVCTPFLMSVPRYTLMMFPIYFLFARASERFFWRVVLTFWSLIFLGLFAASFARGHWTF